MLGRKTAIILGILALLLVMSLGVVAQEETPEATPDGRTYEIFVPSSYDPDVPTPLVMALHGAGGSGAGMQRFSGLDATAEKYGFIAVYPDSLFNNWNFGGYIPGPPTSLRSVDDVRFLAGLVNDLSEEYNIDRDKVFVTGHSNGASMAYLLVCDAPGVFAGLAAVSAPIPVMLAENCENKLTEPLSFMLIQGTNDQILTWNETYSQLTGELVALSAVDTMIFWAVMDECDADTLDGGELPDVDPDDGSVVRYSTLTGCANNTQVVLYGIIGGGHTWPGHPTTMDSLGSVNMDIDASDLIWEWFDGLDDPAPETEESE
jgi:polyhydroxybutyrate depolymerase